MSNTFITFTELYSQTYESIIRAPSIIIKYSLYTDIVVQIVDDATSVVVSAADDSCHRLSVVS